MPRPVTLADLHRSGKLVECGCTACRTVEYLTAEEFIVPLNVEVPMIQRWWKCRQCGAQNTPTAGPVWVRPDSRM